jgi:outer membrane PBP1 activator LpoA protein
MNTFFRHPARVRSRVASAFVLLVLLFSLSACETTGGGSTSTSSGSGRADRLAQNGDHAEAANVFIAMASATTGIDRDRFTLLAVEQWLYAGDVNRARNAFDTVTRPQSGDVAWLYDSDTAALAIIDGDAETALRLLEPLSRQSLPLDYRLRIEALRADAWIQQGDPARAVELMIQRENWLSGSRAIEQNRTRLWQGLTLGNPLELRAAADVAVDPVIKGWLTLGSLAASTGQQGIGWSNGVVRWRDLYPRHPAMTIVDDLQLSEDQLLDYPRQIALLLPLSGRRASVGEAVQNGFLGAYFATAGGLDDRQTIHVYDVNTEGGASAAYATAVADGAEFVVGPLLAGNVVELANDILVPVPVLTLNYLPQNTLAPPGLYQFALSPEDEALAAAERAIADGHSHALAMVPDSNWGRRVFASFATAFESMGGTVLDSRRFATGTPDFSNTIEDLMGLSGSVRRYQRLRANIGAPLQFDPRRRQDADFIFLAADASAGRLIKSQLKFHYSGDLPVYSTSSINAMDGRSDSDLNGVMFADTPWIIGPQSWIQHLPALYEEHWPEQRRLGRLHAMGYDAYYLVGSLFASRGGFMDEIDGATGELFLADDGRVHRRMAWAQFQRGVPVSLPDPDSIGGPIQDLSNDGELLPPDASDAEPWLEPIAEPIQIN